MMRDKLKINALALRGIAIAMLVILFFLGVIIAYYVMLTSETRQRIIKNSEHVAETSAQEIHTYLSNGIYNLQLVCHTLDDMLCDEKPQDDIRSFLTNQTVAIDSKKPVAEIPVGEHHGAIWLH